MPSTVCAARSKKPPASRVRSLLRDLADALGLQMRYWGMDAQGGDGSLLVAAGLTRVARKVSIGEGSSRYWEAWRGGWIEIHSYCAGFYHPSERGILFSRADSHIDCSTDGGAPDPVSYRERKALSGPDTVLASLTPFLEWILDYEGRVGELRGEGYRELCWKQLGGRRFGVPPRELRDWLESLLACQETTPRLHRMRETHSKKNRQPPAPVPNFF